MKRILTGIKSTGAGMHLWNYLWACKPLFQISQWRKTYFMIADLHSLTTVKEAELMKNHKKRLLREYFSLLWTDTELVVFEQSALSHHTDIMWALMSVTPYSLMLRAHTFKDNQNKNSDINMATFNYPILMAADIINFDTDLVPVWKDQQQHIEFARDIAGNFNKTYNVDFFKLPEALISEEVGTIPWIDGRKMSKSYGNHIWVFDDEKTLKKKIMSIETDSKWLEEPKDPDTCNIFALMKFFAPDEQLSEIAEKYRAWWYGYGHAKLDLLSIILEYFKEARVRYFSDDHALDALIAEKLDIGNKEASSIVSKKYKELSKIIWL